MERQRDQHDEQDERFTVMRARARDGRIVALLVQEGEDEKYRGDFNEMVEELGLSEVAPVGHFDALAAFRPFTAELEKTLKAISMITQGLSVMVEKRQRGEKVDSRDLIRTVHEARDFLARAHLLEANDHQESERPAVKVIAMPFDSVRNVA